MYPLLQSVPPITKYNILYPNTKCTPYHKVYPLLQSIPPITNNVPYYTEVYPLSRSKYSQLRSMCTLCNKVCFLLIIPTPITRYLILTLITPHTSTRGTESIRNIFVVRNSKRRDVRTTTNIRTYIANAHMYRLCGARSGSPQLGECSTLWGERERGSVVGMGVYVSSHRKLIGHIGCCCSPQLLAFSAGRAHTG